LHILTEGNWRFRASKLVRMNAASGWHIDVTQDQRPVAAILTCADSRLFMESIFDCGRGELFVCRVAGNVVDDSMIGSLEFAVAKLYVPLVLVLGHEACGALAAACDQNEDPGRISKLVEMLRPAVDIASREPGNLHENSIRANVRLAVQTLRTTDPILSSAISAGELAVEGAYYHLSTGEVELMHI
jgi:carbonic anhydrase